MLLVCTASVLNLVIGMLTRNIMSGILIATLAMIHFLMLTSLFVNFGKPPPPPIDVYPACVSLIDLHRARLAVVCVHDSRGFSQQHVACPAADAMSIKWLRWLKRVSFFNYAFDGLSVNELYARKIQNFPVSAVTPLSTAHMAPEAARPPIPPPLHACVC
jgi:hypothetical protein